MTPPRERLLDDVFPAPEAAADHATHVWRQILRQKKRRRRQFAAAGAVALVCAGLAAWLHAPTRHAAAVVEATPAVPARDERPPVRFIDDDELLAALGDVPAAVATLPDGSKRLLLVPPRR